MYEELRAQAACWWSRNGSRRLKVRRAVVEEADRLERSWRAEKRLDCVPSAVAQTKLKACRGAGDREGVKFWRSVLVYLAYSDWYLGQPRRVSIVEEKEGNGRFHPEFEAWRGIVPAWFRSKTGRALKVRRSVAEAAGKLGKNDFEEALERIGESWEAHDRKSVEFWRTVYSYVAYLRTCEARGKRPNVKIVED